MFTGDWLRGLRQLAASVLSAGFVGGATQGLIALNDCSPARC